MTTARPIRVLALMLVAMLAVLQAGCESKVTPANYEQIKVGMSFSQVEGILGSGEQETSAGTSIDSSGLTGTESDEASERQTWIWTDGDSSIVVNFIGGQVVSKNKRGL